MSGSPSPHSKNGMTPEAKARGKVLPHLRVGEWRQIEPPDPPTRAARKRHGARSGGELDFLRNTRGIGKKLRPASNYDCAELPRKFHDLVESIGEVLDRSIVFVEGIQ